jgi:hypothetical protein
MLKELLRGPEVDNDRPRDSAIAAMLSSSEGSLILLMVCETSVGSGRGIVSMSGVNGRSWDP